MPCMAHHWECCGCMTLGERLRQLRDMKRLSQDELGQRAAVPPSVIAAVESGRQATVPLDTQSSVFPWIHRGSTWVLAAADAYVAMMTQCLSSHCQ